MVSSPGPNGMLVTCRWSRVPARKECHNQDEEAHHHRKQRELERPRKAVNQDDGWNPDQPVGEQNSRAGVRPKMPAQRSAGA